MHLLSRIAGIALILGGTAGLILSVAGLVVIMQLVPRAQAALNHELDVIDRALSATSAGLGVADTSLGRADTTVGSLQTTLGSTGEALTATLPTLNTLNTLTSQTLPTTIESTQQALGSARETARIADSILGAISALRLLPTETYNPEVPLNVAIGQVSSSLDGLPQSLRDIGGGLTIASTNLQVVKADLDSVSSDIGTINASLKEARSVIGQYQDVIADLQAEVSGVRAAAPVWLNAAAWGVALILIWLGIAQIGLLTQGWELIQRSRREM